MRDFKVLRRRWPLRGIISRGLGLLPEPRLRETRVCGAPWLSTSSVASYKKRHQVHLIFTPIASQTSFGRLLVNLFEAEQLGVDLLGVAVEAHA